MDSLMSMGSSLYSAFAPASDTYASPYDGPSIPDPASYYPAPSYLDTYHSPGARTSRDRLADRLIQEYDDVDEALLSALAPKAERRGGGGRKHKGHHHGHSGYGHSGYGHKDDE